MMENVLLFLESGVDEDISLGGVENILAIVESVVVEHVSLYRRVRRG